MKIRRGHFSLLYSTILVFIILLLTFFSVFAQGIFSIVVYPPDLDEFPKVTLYLDAYDAQGKFIPGLDLNSFMIYENGFEMPVNETSLLEPGLHSIIAINLGATLSNRANTTLPTRFEALVFDIAQWLNGLSSEAANQYSLTSNQGVLVEKLQEKDAFTFQLQNYKPNLFNYQPDLTSLSLALDIAAKPNLIPQSKQSLLYVTPLPLDQDIPAISEMANRAVDLRVPVNVWLMAPETAVNAPAAAALNQLATSTGGKFLLYTEETAAPDPETYLGLMRSIYRLRYTSNLSESGAHSLRVKALYGSQEAESSEIPFSIDLTIPSAMLVDLPAEINRQYVNSGSGRELQPGFITLQAEFLFPDGYNRQLEATRLYVDGELIAENTEEPFNFFPWPLENYIFTAEHLISVEIEDILGFRSISPPRPVRITVESLYPGWLSAFFVFFNRGGWVLFAILGLGGAVLVGVRIQRNALERASLPPDIIANGGAIDPLLQSVPGIDASTADAALSSGYTPIQSAESMEAYPCLIQEGVLPTRLEQPIYITEEELIMGSDASLASVFLPHTSVSPRHASLRRDPSGAAIIADMRSGSGTWINYTPISFSGKVLTEGDLVRVGEYRFRYTLGLNG